MSTPDPDPPADPDAPVIVIPAGVPGPDGQVRPYPVYSDAYDLIFGPPGEATECPRVSTPAGPAIAEAEAAVKRAEFDARQAELQSCGGRAHQAALARLDRARAVLVLIRSGLPADPIAATAVLIERLDGHKTEVRADLREIAAAIVALEDPSGAGRPR